MLGGLLERLLARHHRQDDAEGGTRFVPSRLDASVLFAHGASKDESERELAEIQEEARSLEERHRRE